MVKTATPGYIMETSRCCPAVGMGRLWRIALNGLSVYRIAHAIGAATAVAFMLTILDFVAVGAGTDAYYADPARPAVIELAHPPLPYGPNRNDGEAGFPRENAGISAYYRIPTAQIDGVPDNTAHRLNVKAVATALTSPLENDELLRAAPAEVVNLGLNFGIITIPMQGAIVPSTPPPTEVSVYFDDQGWIIAYLPANTPPAAIWRYSSAEPAANGDNANSDLDDNFLSRAIGLVVSAAMPEADSNIDAYAGPSGYYDWQNPQCDAYVLFSNSVGKQDPHPVRFIIPERIEHIRASAAVLTIDPRESGSTDVSRLYVDDIEVVSSSRDTEQTPHRAANFTLARADGPVSQHAMTITASPGVEAAGVVMLMYDKPN